MILTFPMHEIIVAFEDFGGFMRPKQEKKKALNLPWRLRINESFWGEMLANI